MEPKLGLKPTAGIMNAPGEAMKLARSRAHAPIKPH